MKRMKRLAWLLAAGSLVFAGCALEPDDGDDDDISEAEAGEGASDDEVAETSSALAAGSGYRSFLVEAPRNKGLIEGNIQWSGSRVQSHMIIRRYGGTVCGQARYVKGGKYAYKKKCLSSGPGDSMSFSGTGVSRYVVRACTTGAGCTSWR